ncbi:MAG: copper amine oxidase N-terminal domain-containing protein [Bacillota bacterium]|nr:copper amine oxidase N-terminal domain-containing protein [Bacillota bacterium]
MIPLEVVERELGYNVAWNEEKREVVINKEDKIIVLKIDRNTAVVNGRQVMMDINPIQIYEDIYVPLRFASENMGMTVGYFNPAVRGESVPLNDYRAAIFVDEKYEVDNLISREDAMILVKERCLNGLENYKKSLRENLVSNGEDPERFQEEMTLVEKSINKIEYFGEVSRYYVFDMNIYQVILDKMKGKMYFKYDMGLATYIKWLDIDSPHL